MVLVKEIFYCRNIRLFRWNEKLFKNKVSNSEGLALFSIINTFKTFSRPHLDKIELVENQHQIVVPFNLSELFAKEKNLGPNLARKTRQFLSNTVKILGEQISNYLFTRFQIEPLIILKPNRPKTVIVVEVKRLRIIFDNAKDSNVGISKFIPPEIPPPQWTLEVAKDEDENEDEDENDPCNSYANDIHYYLRGLKNYLGVEMDFRTRRPLTRDEPRGFVEILPIEIGKRWEEFDKTVETCGICQDGFVDVDDKQICTTSCFHVFHRHCISRWLVYKNSCPTCRLVLPFSFDNI
ncbi:hypothetical protein ACH5RR_003604 [Cinchona calisaya]|uniref:RING-type domain-containing protein n=1 Tax=Cinchona calisaya TaxID=153742 RepID=A0ABD3AVQ7_9GENT